MEQIISILKNNWELIVAVVIFILSFILQAVRKKPANAYVTCIFFAALEAVKAAEYSGLKGVDKFHYCLDLVYKNLKGAYPDINPSSYYGIIHDIIENILSTPQKKGGNADGK